MISEKLQGVILKTLGLAEFPLTEATTASQVPGWDSLRHVAVLCEIEKVYAIRFRSIEVIGLKTVGDLQRLVDAKAKSR